MAYIERVNKIHNNEETNSGTAAEIFDDLIPISEEGIRVQSCNWDICCFQGGNLIVHQGKERRYDNRNAMINNSGQLETETFAKGSRCEL